MAPTEFEIVGQAAPTEPEVNIDDIFFNDADEEELVDGWFASVSSTERPEVDEWLFAKPLPPKVGLGATKIAEEKNKKSKELDEVSKQVKKAVKREKDRMDMAGLADLAEDRKRKLAGVESDSEGEEAGRGTTSSIGAAKSKAQAKGGKKFDAFSPWQQAANAKNKKKRRK